MPSNPAPPALEAIRALPLLLQRSVPPSYEDFNGHMSIAHHLGIHNEAGPAYLRTLGLDEEQVIARGSSIFDAEHHLRYYGEVMVGDTVAVHSRALARSDKAMHGLWFLVDETREELANTLEWVTIHVDLAERRPAPWPEDVAARLDELITADAKLDWDPPLCGAMGVG